MRLSKETEYAVMSLAAMSGEDRHYSSRELSERHGIPGQLESKILQRLAAVGMIQSIQGPHGGYRLNKSVHDITLKEVIQAVEEDSSLVRCMTDGNTCSQAPRCNINKGMQTLNRRWLSVLGSFSVGDFVSRSAGAL